MRFKTKNNHVSYFLVKNKVFQNSIYILSQEYIILSFLIKKNKLMILFFFFNL